ncbi:hypothetical protein BpHYR1_035154 [Brachionus plicatilis]|uniref:Ig-like domain-containing protein n=1 Tax=Brachionus plicatilis TaxID=10195 RepID=A0A3M7SEK0_BRAPC|nr:hypothetical protein BpHYR1_035154 [Brachionus plicatilis]
MASYHLFKRKLLIFTYASYVPLSTRVKATEFSLKTRIARARTRWTHEKRHTRQNTILPDVKLHWQTETDQIDEGIKIMELNRTQKILIIDSFELRHIGIYTCHVQIKNSIFYEHENWIKFFILNSKFENFYEIRVIYSKLTPNLAYQINSTSNSISIECKNRDQNLTTKWFKLSNMSMQVFEQSKIELDRNKIAKYECSSENDFGTSKITFNNEKNQIYWSEFSSWAKKMPEMVVTLKCPLNSDKIFWFKSGKKLPENNLKNSSYLFINETQFSDQGSYECSTHDFKKVYTIELILSEPIPIMTENSFLLFNISNYLKGDKFSLSISFKPFNLDGIIWSLSKNDENITVSLNNGIVYYDSKQKNSVDVLVKIPKIWNQLKIELFDQEVLLVLNDQNFKIFSGYDVKNIGKNLCLGSENFHHSNFIGIISNLKKTFSFNSKSLSQFNLFIFQHDINTKG